jgi:hypothetical protein
MRSVQFKHRHWWGWVKLIVKSLAALFGVFHLRSLSNPCGWFRRLRIVALIDMLANRRRHNEFTYASLKSSICARLNES